MFLTHDVIHHVLNNMPELFEENKGQFVEKNGTIYIGNNVFIGANSIILYNTHIGNNVIIGAGSIVTKDIPDGSVAVGCPANVIDSFDHYVEKQRRGRD